MRRRILLASAGAMALAGAANAADLQTRAPPVYLTPPPAFTWTGFYAGLNAGYNFGGSNSVDVETASGVAIAGIQSFADAVAASATDVLSLRNSGFIGGGQVGYNLQFASSWVAGIEADIQGTAARSSAGAIRTVPVAGVPSSILQAQSNISVNNAVDYLGTVRGRLGFLLTPALLVYGDGGFAYGGVHEGVDVVSTLPPSGGGLSPAFGSLTNTRPGWTAGGGLEWMVSPNWSVKAEYLYYDLGRVTFGVGGLTQTLFPAGPALFTDFPVASTRFNGHIVRVGLNYHFDWWNPGSVDAMVLGGAAHAADPPTGSSPVYLPPPPVFSWTGVYAGLNAGYTFGGSNSVDVETASGVATSEQSFADAVAASTADVLSLRNSGFIGGGQVGYNLQFASSWVAGIEADIQGTAARSSAGAIRILPVAGIPPSILQAQSNISVNNAVDYLGTVRGRLGVLMTPALLVYGDGGFAYGGVHEGVDVVVTAPPTGEGTSPAFGSLTNTRPGWTAGGGLEWMVSPNWSVKAEYLYYDLGRVTFGSGGLTHFSAGPALFTDFPVASTRFNGHIVRVGLNYHFDWWNPGPVVAKY